MKLNLSVKKKSKPAARDDLIPSGSTMLNLALSDDPFGGYQKGSLVNIVGDSSAGKTTLVLNCFAEVLHNKKLSNYYNVYYDEPERKLQIRIGDLYGSIENKMIFVHDKFFADADYYRVEDFHSFILGKAKHPYIYGLDSLDACTSKQEIAKAKEALAKGDKAKGSYGGADKAKIIGQVLRQIMSKHEKTDSLLMIVSQMKWKIDVAFGERRTRAGGEALRYHAMHEFWLHVKNHITRKGREVGVQTKIRFKKNHLTGRLWEVEFPIYYDYGIDDTTSIIDWLIEEGFWKYTGKKGISKIDTGGDFPNHSKEKLIDHIEEDEEKIIELKMVAGECWNKIIEETSTKRKPRYS